MALTEDAKNELAEAFRIVKEDKYLARIRNATKREATPPPGPGPTPPPTPPGPTPPPAVPPTDPPTPPSTGAKSAYWGELLGSD